MIDLEKFTKVFTVDVPIINKTFQYNRKKYSIKKDCVDGWYSVKIDGNIAAIETTAVIEFDPIFKQGKNILKGYTYHNNFIFQNFDVGKRKAGVEVMMPLYLNNVPTFSSIEAILWEDKNLYYYQPNYVDPIVYQLKAAYETVAGMKALKGLTPELKILFLFHDIERQKLIADQERLKKEHEIEEFAKTLPGRLMISFNRVGAKLLNYVITGTRITVDWELASGTQFNSVLDAETFRVIEAGYCMSGQDKQHSLTSMVKLAEDYQERRVIHKTRGDFSDNFDDEEE